MNSKLVLGTVQLGMKYGLANTHGQPSHDEAFAILDAALAGGVEIFDTAFAYGTAEDVLGAWITERGLKGKVKIISKMKPHALDDYPAGTSASAVVESEINKSLARLGLDSLDGYLLHTPEYIYNAEVIEGLQQVKAAGLAQNIGVSIYDEPEALAAAKIPLDYIQVPYNAFDQRLDVTDFFDIAKQNNVTVFARSPYLQGLLLMQPSDLPEHLRDLQPHVEKFDAIARESNLSREEAALGFVLAASRADYVVLGVETLAQLQEDIGTAAPAAGAAWVREIQEAFKTMDRGAINPSLWSKKK